MDFTVKLWLWNRKRKSDTRLEFSNQIACDDVAEVLSDRKGDFTSYLYLYYISQGQDTNTLLLSSISHPRH